jgi:23S rRNA (cytosine1962-C5)-methyltransferase
MPISILYRDDDLVVIDKPAGVIMRAAGDPYPGDALRMAQAQLGLSYLTTQQWLDTEVSGVLVCAARPEVYAAMESLVVGRTVEYVYLALVHGAPPAAAGVVDAALLRETTAPGEGERYRVARPHEKRAQRAVTRYRVVETAPGGQYSLLEAIPEAAPSHPLRIHQLRLHLAHLGTPVVGDPIYGRDSAAPASVGGKAGDGKHPPTDKNLPVGRNVTVAAKATVTAKAAEAKNRVTAADRDAPPPFAPRLGLHVCRVTMPHPLTGHSVTFTAPPPALFTRLAVGLPELALAAAGKHIRKVKPTAGGLAGLIDLALARRAPLAADPQTTLYRLINAAADGLPGLTVDRYGDALVVGIYDEVGRPDPLPPALMEQLTAATGASSVYVKYRQRQASQVEEEDLPSLTPSTPVVGRALGEYGAREDGLSYLVRPGEGWNPGLFADMREMRGRVRAWSAGKRVLNTFAYTCGFGVAALAGGASRVVNVDVSWPTLEHGRANYRANGFTPGSDDFLYGDTFDWLPRLAARHELFDLIILDPPGFARTKTHLFSAVRDYGKLAAAAATVLAPDGLLVACCNVADLPWATFRKRVQAGLDTAWRAAKVVAAYQAPVLDYPTVTGHESHLKILVARLD